FADHAVARAAFVFGHEANEVARTGLQAPEFRRDFLFRSAGALAFGFAPERFAFAPLKAVPRRFTVAVHRAVERGRGFADLRGRVGLHVGDGDVGAKHVQEVRLRVGEIDIRACTKRHAARFAEGARRGVGDLPDPLAFAVELGHHAA